MIRPARVRTVAEFELLSAIRRKAYLFATFGLPLFAAAYAGFFGLIAEMGEASLTGTGVFAVVDEGNVLGEATGSTGDEIAKDLYRYESLEVAKRDLLSGALDHFYRIPVGFVENGTLDVYYRDGIPVASVGGDQALERLLVRSLLEGHIGDALATRIGEPIEARNEWAIAEDGAISERSIAAQLASLILPMVFVMLFAMSLLMTSGLMVTAVSIEKENRVVEVLLASATAEEILAGKLLGLGAAGLLQVSVWFSMVLGGGVATAMSLELLGWAVPWLGIGISAVFFAVAYLFVGSLMIGTGSLGSTQREGQLLGIPWTLLTLSPLFMIVPLVTEPNGTMARTLSFIPFTAPVTIVLRAFAGPAELPLWEVALALVVLIGFTYLAIALAARLFRVGLLLSGARPSLRQILRQAGFGARAT